MIHEILYESALGRIQPGDRERLLRILQFARSSCTIEASQPLPAYQDEEHESVRDDSPKAQRMLFEK